MYETNTSIDTERPKPEAARTERPFWFQPRVLAILLAAIVGLGFWVADWKWPAKSMGKTNSGSTTTTGLPRRFKVATFNIHGGKGLDGRFDLQRTAECLKEMDFVGLNEAYGPTFGDSRNQAEILGQLLGMDSLFAPSEVGWWGPRFGQGAVSRFGISSWLSTSFERRVGNGYRNYVECKIPFHPDPGRSSRENSLTILFTHLDRKSDRQDQLRLIINQFLTNPLPVILMGDLNSKRTEVQLQELAKQPGVIDCFGRFAKEPLVTKRIDWIFVRGLNCLDANLEANDASDHPWGWAELEVPEPP